MADYEYTKEVSGELLHVQIVNSEDISQSPSSIVTSGEDVVISFAEALTSEEEDTLDALVAAHDASDGAFYQRYHYRRTPKSGPVEKEEWFETIDVQAGTLSGLAKRITYTNSGSKCTQYIVETFFKGGTVALSETFKCYTDADNNYIEEKVIS